MTDQAMYIGGRVEDSGPRVEVRNPANIHEVVGSVPEASSEHVNEAVEAAHIAFGEWSRWPMSERADVLADVARSLEQDIQQRSNLLSREGGALLAEAERSVRGASRFLAWYAELGRRFEVDETLPSETGRVIVTHQPMGVAVVIVPWNAPTNLGFLGIAPALVAGNTVVVKPPSDAPLALVEMVHIAAAGLPPGVLNVVTGPGSRVGTALVEHPKVRKINFTGSTEGGKEVLKRAANTVKRVSMELGGNDPALVLSDADLDHAIPELVTGTFNNAGQICYAVKRIYVDRKLFGDFVAGFRETANRIVVGEGLDARSTMGAVINSDQLRTIESLVGQAEASGARAEKVGSKLEEEAWSDGCFHLPTIVTDVSQDAAVVQEEQFGPVIPILPFEDEVEAVALANDSRFGLASSIWTPDEERAFRVGRQLEAGSTFVNIHRRGASGVDMPFGGFKESGVGRSHGEIALREQMELHTISSRRKK